MTKVTFGCIKAEKQVSLSYLGGLAKPYVTFSDYHGKFLTLQRLQYDSKEPSRGFFPTSVLHFGATRGRIVVS